MKLIIISLITLAAISSPMLALACPPPPAPGYDGGEEPGSGPIPDEGTAPTNPGGGAVNPGDDTSSDPGAPDNSSGDETYGDSCI